MRKLLHLQKCFEELGYKEGDLPISERKAHEVISLPVYPGLTKDEQDYMIKSIKDFV